MKIHLLFPLLFVFSAIAYGQQSMQKSIDVNKLNDYLRQLPATIKVSMVVESVTGHRYFAFRPEAKVPAASVIKIPVLIELMEQAGKQEIELTKIYKLTAADKTGGSGIIAGMPDGKDFTLRELAQEMIHSSDNTATNVLIREVGMKAINDNLIRLGSTHTRLNRIMMDTLAARQGRENYVNTVEINDLLRKIYNNKVATPALCKEMLEILKNCADTTTIPRYLPKQVAIAHKTGELSYVRGDAGIVYTGNPFILSVFVEGFSEMSQAEKIIGDLALICWESLK
ncbi:serine hydrolase [Emticicia sp. 21SJ11W-3]|uniref:serine hydrolase n=1 Tax=Emticicia sp. 21SJ11W-3 TaxID=2916755 RepID=UPI0020A1C5DD|nr:serine hydrolase [Emticicia sp. 21SJ11W-3]UTA67351.1 class A beta-lactamase-related serine hydrolase [Emticicia sp. 21SJ11W-3]